MADFAGVFGGPFSAILQSMMGESANWTYTKPDGSSASLAVIVTDSDGGPDDVELSVLYLASAVTSPNREGDRLQDPDGLHWRVVHTDFNRAGVNRARAIRARERP